MTDIVFLQITTLNHLVNLVLARLQSSQTFAPKKKYEVAKRADDCPDHLASVQINTCQKCTSKIDQIKKATENGVSRNTGCQSASRPVPYPGPSDYQELRGFL